MCTLKPPRMLAVWSRGVSGQGFVSSENARERPRGEQTKTPGRTREKAWLPGRAVPLSLSPWLLPLP